MAGTDHAAAHYDGPRTHERPVAHAVQPRWPAAARSPAGWNRSYAADRRHDDPAIAPIHFWAYNTTRFADVKPEPYIDPELQQGTTPLAKLAGGKATRDFSNYRHPAINEADYLGPRAIIDGNFKLVIHEQERGKRKPNSLISMRTQPRNAISWRSDRQLRPGCKRSCEPGNSRCCRA